MSSSSPTCSTPELVSCTKAYSGNLIKYTFLSTSLGSLETKFNLFIPPTSTLSELPKKVPVLYYLAGLTCNEDTGAQKGGLLAEGAKHGIAIVFPDTSPRGAKIEGEEDDWDFGTGAGFYLSATHPKWKKHYQMEKLITEELPEVLAKTGHPLDLNRQSIFGHSMGGHGALTLYLNHRSKYQSCSAFAPIMNPTQCGWGKKAFSGPKGDDGYLLNGIEEGKSFDATELIKRSEDLGKLNILVDYGDADQFYTQNQLLPENFLDAIQVVNTKDKTGFSDLSLKNVNVRRQKGYDHSYYFISSFAADHVSFHAKYLFS